MSVSSRSRGSIPYATAGFNPIVVDDVMYVLGRSSSLVALDATTGKEIWIHEGLRGITSRGINYWQSEDGKDKPAAVLDQQLPAGDRRAHRQVDPDLRRRTAPSICAKAWRAPSDMPDASSRAAPARSGRTCIILGSAPGEASSPPGDIRAYDVVTGKKVWQFHTVPQPGEFGYDTWPKDAYKYVGGANNWG